MNKRIPRAREPESITRKRQHVLQEIRKEFLASYGLVETLLRKLYAFIQSTRPNSPPNNRLHNEVGALMQVYLSARKAGKEPGPIPSSIYLAFSFLNSHLTLLETLQSKMTGKPLKKHIIIFRDGFENKTEPRSTLLGDAPMLNFRARKHNPSKKQWVNPALGMIRV